MERAIKFRGKDANNGEWVYGDLIQLDTQLCIAGLHQWAGVHSNNSIEIDVTKVIPETVGQYTGFTDKNGAQVFEGDLVEALNAAGDPYDGKGVGAIEWLGSFGYWNVSEIELSLGDLNYEGYIKVIGNIHDNKDLLKLD